MTRYAITEEILRTRLRQNVRARRTAASLTLKKASERAEMHWRHWQKIEAGQVNLTVQTLVRIADVLGVDPADLLREPPPPRLVAMPLPSGLSQAEAIPPSTMRQLTPLAPAM